MYVGKEFKTLHVIYCGCVFSVTWYMMVMMSFHVWFCVNGDVDQPLVCAPVCILALGSHHHMSPSSSSLLSDCVCFHLLVLDECVCVSVGESCGSASARFNRPLWQQDTSVMILAASSSIYDYSRLYVYVCERI